MSCKVYQVSVRIMSPELLKVIVKYLVDEKTITYTVSRLV